VIPAHLSELSPDSVAGFLPGFGYQCGVFFSSSVVYVEAVFAKQHTYAVVMAMTAATGFCWPRRSPRRTRTQGTAFWRIRPSRTQLRPNEGGDRRVLRARASPRCWSPAGTAALTGDNYSLEMRGSRLSLQAGIDAQLDARIVL